MQLRISTNYNKRNNKPIFGMNIFKTPEVLTIVEKKLSKKVQYLNRMQDNLQRYKHENSAVALDKVISDLKMNEAELKLIAPSRNEWKYFMSKKLSLTDKKMIFTDLLSAKDKYKVITKEIVSGVLSQFKKLKQLETLRIKLTRKGIPDTDKRIKIIDKQIEFIESPNSRLSAFEAQLNIR